MVSVTLLMIIYVSFVSLGLPDSLLGSAWPTMLTQIDVPVWGAGLIQMTASLCTIISSLNSAKLIRRFGTGKLTAISTGLTALALLGYSFAPNFIVLFLMSIPLGLGAGAVDAGINNYVAQHCEPRHMNWLHCFWGVGTVISPLILSAALSAGFAWRWGYRTVSALQAALCIVLFATLRLWKSGSIEEEEKSAKVLSVRQVLALPGALAGMTTFFCYCAAESTLLLWAPTFMVMTRGISPEKAASFGSLFCIGITLGRAVSGFMTLRFAPRQMVRMGHAGMAIGAVMMLLPVDSVALAGVIVAGLGCAPVYPNIMQDTPVNYGAENSQAAVGVQMAFAYCGSLFVPTIFAFFADVVGYGLMPPFLLALVAAMAVLFNVQAKIVDGRKK